MPSCRRFGGTMQQPRNVPEGSGNNARRWSAIIRQLVRKIAHPYRPERHYMRGGRTNGGERRRREADLPHAAP